MAVICTCNALRDCKRNLRGRICAVTRAVSCGRAGACEVDERPFIDGCGGDGRLAAGMKPGGSHGSGTADRTLSLLGDPFR